MKKKMMNGGSELRESQMKQEEKLMRKKVAKDDRLMSKGTTCPSFRVYYYDGGGGGGGSVPFEWESQPGTPKHTLSYHPPPLLPLTPPPSHHYSSSHQTHPKPLTTTNIVSTSPISKLFHLVVFPKFWSLSGHKVKNVAPSSSSSMSSVALMLHHHDYNMFKYRRRSRFWSFDSGTSTTREDATASTSCFGIRRCCVCNW